MGSSPGRSTLNIFYLFYVSVGVGRPDRGGVFQLWSNKCFVGCGFGVLVMNFDVAFEKAQRLICFFVPRLFEEKRRDKNWLSVLPSVRPSPYSSMYFVCATPTTVLF